MSDVLNKIKTLTIADVAWVCSLATCFMAMYCICNGDEQSWKDYFIASLMFALAFDVSRIKQMKAEIDDLQRKLIEQKRGRYDQIVLNRLRERNG